MTTVHLLTRQTVDWRDEQAFLAQLPSAFAPKVESWNATFHMPYHLFRQAIREIAIRNHEAIAGAVPATWEAIPDGAIVLPSDDDDWFSPEVASSIASAFAAGIDGVHWTQSVLEMPINFLHRVNLTARRVFPWLKPKWFCATNNYAFRRAEDAADLLSHIRASRRFTSGTIHTTFVPRRLSLHNRTLASITSMGFGEATISRNTLRRKADGYRRLYDGPSLMAGLEWARPDVRAMKDLMANLTLR